MATSVVLDTGPLVAWIDRRDPSHRWTTEQLRQLQPPFLTCEAVVSEALFLLEDVRGGAALIMGMLREDLVRLDFNLHAQLGSVSALLAKYHNVPMSLADGCLVRMSELHDRAQVFTLDADFKFYRRHSRQAIPLIYPAS